MICAYCESALPDGAVRCDNCGAARPGQKLPKIVQSLAGDGDPVAREIAFLPVAGLALLASLAMWWTGAQVVEAGETPLWFDFLTIFWILLVMPGMLLRQAWRSGLSASGHFILKALMALILIPIFLVISMLGVI